MSEKIHIYVCADQRYAPGLWVTVLSCIASCSARERLCFTVLDGGISNEFWDRLVKQAALWAPATVLCRRTVDISLFNSCSPFNESLLVYGRLLIPTLHPTGTFIYLDSDLLVTRDICELWETDLKRNLVAACPDACIKMTSADSPLPAGDQRGDMPYFNSGVMLVDSSGWRTNSIVEKATGILSTHHCEYADQTALNEVLKGRVLYLADHWNRFPEQAEAAGSCAPSITHFVWHKTWIESRPNIFHQLFHQFARKSHLPYTADERKRFRHSLLLSRCVALAPTLLGLLGRGKAAADWSALRRTWWDTRNPRRTVSATYRKAMDATLQALP